MNNLQQQNVERLSMQRFHALNIEHIILPGLLKPDLWYWKYQLHTKERTFGCCSKDLIAFHYVSPIQMHVVDFIVYNLRVHR